MGFSIRRLSPRSWQALLARGLAFGATLLLGTASTQAATLRLSELDLGKMTFGWKAPVKNRSIDGAPLRIGAQTFQDGIGTHAGSSLRIELHGTVQRLTAMVGVDDEVGKKGSVEFSAWADAQRIWSSGVMKGGEPPKSVSLDLTGKRTLVLIVSDAGDNMDFDHADWASGELTYTGQAPAAGEIPAEKATVLTPPAPPTPRINGARVFGVRPGSPCLYTIAATGERPMTFAAQGLPKGLRLDGKTGQITGKLEHAGEFTVQLTATNARGKATRPLRIVAGDKIALTPPLGWNSWNCWGSQVSQAKVLASARAMAQKGLIEHGWSYINIDDGWQATRGGKFNAIQPNRKFPDMAGLAAQVHALGLRLGIYSTPWRGSYAGFIGGSCDNADGTYDWIKEGRHSDIFQIANPVENHKFGRYSFVKNDVRQWAAWGIDYLKYDWYPNDVEHVREMSQALRACGRDIAYSLSNTAPFEHAADWAQWANAWRTTGDINDSWGSVSSIGFTQGRWAPSAGPGHWNDPDMLVVGKVGWGDPHPSRLTPNEQYTHISLWCLLAAPLLIGCDMEQLDAFTLGLLTNDEVLAVDQDPLAVQGRRVKEEPFAQVWAKPLEDGSLAVGLFNLGEWEMPVSAAWADLGLKGEYTVRDLWRQQDLGPFSGQFKTTVPRHGVVLVQLRKAV